MTTPFEPSSDRGPATAGPQPSDGKARFEAMLRQVLTTDEAAQEHRSAKDQGTVARHAAAGARAKRSRERPARSRRPGPGKGR